jgi:hypothetical protein
VSGSYEEVYESSGSVKGLEVFDLVIDYQLLKKDSSSWDLLVL